MSSLRLRRTKCGLAPSISTIVTRWYRASSSSSSSFVPNAGGGDPDPSEGGSGGAAARPPYASSSQYTLERMGEYDPQWLHSAEAKRLLDLYQHQAQYLPSLSELRKAPAFEALMVFATRRPYHDVLHLIMEHSFFFLMEFAMGCQDAPLPHVIYEDYMKVLTFSSLQRPPEKQFQLERSTRLLLLLSCARYCLVDPLYYTQARQLFRRMEQQQTLHAGDYAAFVYICAASAASSFEEDEIDAGIAPASGSSSNPLLTTALDTLCWLSDHHITFSPQVYAHLLHPSVDPFAFRCGQQPHVSRGMLLQQRFAAAWSRDQEEGCAFTVGFHAVFVHYSLTLQTRWMWRWLAEGLRRHGNHQGYPVSYRTIGMAVAIVAARRGAGCPAEVMKALLRYHLHDTASRVVNVGGEWYQPVSVCLFLLLRARRTEWAEHTQRMVAATAEGSSLQHVRVGSSRTEPAHKQKRLLRFTPEERRDAVKGLKQLAPQAVPLITSLMDMAGSEEEGEPGFLSVPISEDTWRSCFKQIIDMRRALEAMPTADPSPSLPHSPLVSSGAAAVQPGDTLPTSMEQQALKDSNTAESSSSVSVDGQRQWWKKVFTEVEQLDCLTVKEEEMTPVLQRDKGRRENLEVEEEEESVNHEVFSDVWEKV